jgi:anti-sigma regulatory factor (Ser/Thr protein kinase)
MALRAYAIESESPGEVVARMQQLVRALGVKDMATMIYLVYDPDSGLVVFANAGHPPPLLISESGQATFLEEGLSPPLGTMPGSPQAEATARVAAGSTLLLFTDGLVERRDQSLREGLERLRQVAASSEAELQEVCDDILASMAQESIGDDIALLAIRPASLAGRPLHFRVPAEPRALAPLRHTLRRWLREIQATQQESYEILVACGEACANAVQHPHAAKEGYLDIDIAKNGDEVEVVVRDSGHWRSGTPDGGGHGLPLIHQLMDNVEIERGSRGTSVRMRRRLGRDAHERARTR